MRVSVVVFFLFSILVFLIPLTAIRHYSPLDIVPPAINAPELSTSAKNPDANSQAVTQNKTALPIDEPPVNIPNLTHFNILNTSTGKVEAVSVQDYVRGAVAAELPASFHLEAMKAQAICAHTYALGQHMLQLENRTPGLLGADFSADPNNRQGYATEASLRTWYGDSFDVHWAKICEAADSTMNTILLYEGDPILAAYHSASGGFTEDAGNVWMTHLPYLLPVESEGDLLSPTLESSESFTSAELSQKLSAEFEDLLLPSDKTKWFSIVERSGSDYVTLIDVGNLTLHGKDIRTALNLRSTNFTIKYKNNTFTFDCLGYGHGVGLSQYGADYMARQGATYKEILLHYFSDITLHSIENS